VRSRRQETQKGIARKGRKERKSFIRKERTGQDYKKRNENGRKE
jgi:hypothetical protein